MRIVRHIHGDYDGPPDDCTTCAKHPVYTCQRCRGYTTSEYCGFCFMPRLTVEDKIKGVA